MPLYKVGYRYEVDGKVVAGGTRLHAADSPAEAIERATTRLLEDRPDYIKVNLVIYEPTVMLDDCLSRAKVLKTLLELPEQEFEAFMTDARQARDVLKKLEGV